MRVIQPQQTFPESKQLFLSWTGQEEVDGWTE